MEKDNTTAFVVAEAHKTLKRNLTERKASNFIPMGAKNIYRSLEQVCNSVTEEFDGFYERCIAYLDLWENSFGNAEQFLWVNLAKTNAADWENAETSAEIINSSLLDVPDMKINNDQMFDEVVLAKEYLQSNWEQWEQEETTRDVSISSEEKWLRLFGHFKENHIAAPNLIKIVEYAFCLPGTSAPVERVFSLINNAWTDDRGLMKEATVKGLMTCKINIGLACADFYNKIKNKKDFLKKS
ncbi:hypothetical protein AVEN_230178-1 [Araneus ventricosus]|uniref:HAT C-terminal dimerisation domain-containing protein n=1 Tax=Araneus ventricosus TaxID=182803 RepID=A0A4Y2PE99_ARAVE|nr:hypothetical protein AVEN_230178-1 [Araneus ventricosus]